MDTFWLGTIETTGNIRAFHNSLLPIQMAMGTELLAPVLVTLISKTFKPRLSPLIASVASHR